MLLSRGACGTDKSVPYGGKRKKTQKNEMTLDYMHLAIDTFFS